MSRGGKFVEMVDGSTASQVLEKLLLDTQNEERHHRCGDNGSWQITGMYNRPRDPRDHFRH